MEKYDDDVIRMVNEHSKDVRYVKYGEQPAVKVQKTLSDDVRSKTVKKAIALALLPVMTAAGLVYVNHQMSHQEKLDDVNQTKTEQQYDNNQAEEVTYDDYVQYTQVTGEPMSQEGAKEFADTYDKESYEELLDEYIDSGLSHDNTYRSSR